MVEDFDEEDDLSYNQVIDMLEAIITVNQQSAVDKLVLRTTLNRIHDLAAVHGYDTVADESLCWPASN